MNEIPTIEVKNPLTGGKMIINESDYDASVHELWEEPQSESVEEGLNRVIKEIVSDGINQEIEEQYSFTGKEELDEILADTNQQQPTRKRRERRSEAAE